ncbi:MAG TPA: contractile injection system tape measure protein [Puia sp.]|nr:contractile injection system tape measure protein [Puia sp.]
MQHIVNRQVIELSLRDANGAFHLQQQVSSQFYQRMLAILERVFDSLGDEGELISFDQLVIDMGSVTEKAIQDGSWTEELYAQLSGQAQVLIREGGGRRKTLRRPIGAGILRQWLDYMRTGWLPWNVTVIDRRWLQLLLEHLAADHEAVTVLRENLLGRPVVLRRVVLQHDSRFLMSLTEVLTASDQAALPAALAELELIARTLSKSLAADRDRSGAPDRQRPIDIQTLWSAALRAAANPGTGRKTPAIVQALLAELIGAPVEGGTAASVAMATLLHVQLADRIPYCGPLLAELADAVSPPPEVTAPLESPSSSVAQPVETRSALIPEATHPADQTAIAEQHRSLEEGIFVPYAGMVILHPLLPTFFTRLGLVKDGEFVDEAAQRRGLPLLHYAVTAGTYTADDQEGGAPEYELSIARVLCGFPLSEPVARHFIPTAAEIEEIDGLLDACLAQWTKLGTTSRAGLRGNFLHRAGRLQQKDGRMRLDVERSSIDVLLDYLPWPLSLIRLPWMKEILHVNWR